MIILALSLVFLIAFGVTILLVPPVIRLCQRQGWLAMPGGRRTHRQPTATVGGLAMLGGLFAAILLSIPLTELDQALHRSPYELLRLGLMLGGLSIVAAVSFIDDLRDLPALPRLGLHFLAALIAVGPYLWDQTLYPDVLGAATEARGIILTAFNFPFVRQIHLHEISPWLAIGATVLWIAGIQNMLNWADGLDGLAAGITLIAASVLALHTLRLDPPQYTVAMLPLAIAGVCAAFLIFNFHPAKIFMGDVGAMSLGYLLAVSAIIGGAKLATALLVLGVPLIDMVWLVITRTVRGRGASAAGRDHLHLRLQDLGFSQRQVVAFYYGLSLIFGSIALLDFFTPVMKMAALVVMGGLVLAVVIYAARATPSASTPTH